METVALILRFALRRVGQALLVSLTIATLCFCLIRAVPGDLALRVANARYGEDLGGLRGAALVRAEGSLSRSSLAAYKDWLESALRLDFGNSLVTGHPVGDDVSRHFGRTWRLALVGFLISAFLAVPLGIASGMRPGSFIDLASAGLAAALSSVPSFVIGTALILLFAVELHWFPSAGSGSGEHLALPGLALGLGLSAALSRIIHSAIASTREAPYVDFARWKGMPETPVFWHHVLRNALIPVLAFGAQQFAYLLDGSIVIETLFAYPGIGKLLVTSLLSRDVPTVQAIALLMGLLFVLINSLSDLATLWLDPRRRDGGCQP